MDEENAPGQALVRVENRGAKGIFTATATITDVLERVTNPKFLQTFSLRWRSSENAEMVLASGAVAELLVASVAPTITSPPSGRDLHEFLLEGYRNGQPVIADRFRWHAGDPHGSVMVYLTLTLSSSEAQGTRTRCFVVSSMKWGGIRIEKATPSTPSDETTLLPPRGTMDAERVYHSEGTRLQLTFIANEHFTGSKNEFPAVSFAPGEVPTKVGLLVVHNIGVSPVKCRARVSVHTGIADWPSGDILAVWYGHDSDYVEIEPGCDGRIIVAVLLRSSWTYYRWSVPYRLKGKASDANSASLIGSNQDLRADITITVMPDPPPADSLPIRHLVLEGDKVHEARAIEARESFYASDASDKRARLNLEPARGNLKDNRWAANQSKTLSLSLTNTGHRPATRIRAQFTMDAIPGLTVPDDVPVTQEALSLHPLPPGKTLTFEVHTSAPLSGDVINHILSLLAEPSYIIYVVVVLTYDDGFATTRAATFCWRWDNNLGWTPETKHFHPD